MMGNKSKVPPILNKYRVVKATNPSPSTSNRTSESPSKIMSKNREPQDPLIIQYKPIVRLIAKIKAATPKYIDKEANDIIEKIESCIK
jgi:hypothetical protein